MVSRPAPGPPPAVRAPIFCSLIPREILEAAGLSPVEIEPPEAPDCSGAHACALSDNLCSWVKHLIARLSAADSPFPIVVVPASCDAMTKLHDALVHARPLGSVFRLDVPRTPSAAAVRYLARQYATLLASLGVVDDNLLHQGHAGREAGTEDGPRDKASAGPPAVGLAGSVYPLAVFRDTLEAAGADVTVLRRCGMPLPAPRPGPPGADEGLEAFCERLAAHYVRGAVCPRMAGSGRLVEFLADEVAARGLSGLVVPVLKFCDGYHLAAEDLSKRLPAGFPILLVEGDLTVGFGEQTVTRLEAFVERLKESGPRIAPGGADRLVVGLDVGSTQVKAVLMDGGQRVASVFLRPTTGRMAEASADAIDRLLLGGGVARSAVANVGVTGYGRKSVASDAVATEISCHARGVSRFFSEPATIIDVGGQDSKVIITDGEGRVLRFTMNDKCAAGTGRFIDGMVRALALDFERFSRLSLEAEAEVAVTSMCSVFAESEVISLSARGESLSGIARGINASIARRVAGMVRRIEGGPPFVLTGGVSQIPGFVRELERELGFPVAVSDYALYAGAIGAAMLALESMS